MLHSRLVDVPLWRRPHRCKTRRCMGESRIRCSLFHNWHLTSRRRRRRNGILLSLHSWNTRGTADLRSHRFGSHSCTLPSRCLGNRIHNLQTDPHTWNGVRTGSNHIHQSLHHRSLPPSPTGKRTGMRNDHLCSRRRCCKGAGHTR